MSNPSSALQIELVISRALAASSACSGDKEILHLLASRGPACGLHCCASGGIRTLSRWLMRYATWANGQGLNNKVADGRHRTWHTQLISIKLPTRQLARIWERCPCLGWHLHMDTNTGCRMELLPMPWYQPHCLRPLFPPRIFINLKLRSVECPCSYTTTEARRLFFCNL